MKRTKFLMLAMFLLAGCSPSKAVKPEGISVSIVEPIIAVGETTTISWEITPSDAFSEVVVSSENESVAKANNTQITGIGIGVTRLYVSSKLAGAESVRGYVFVEVVAPVIEPTQVNILAVDGTTVYMGSKLTLTSKTLPSGASQQVTWSSSNSAIATVENGLITPVSEGEAEITAASVVEPKVSAKVTVNVKTLPASQSMDFYDLTNEGSFGTVKLSTFVSLDILKGKSDGIITSVTQSHAVYSGNGSSGAPYSNEVGLLKFGAKTEGPGRLSFTTNAPVRSISIVAADWGDQDGKYQEYTEILVNQVAQLAPYNTYTKLNSEGVEIVTSDPETCKGELTYEFAEPTNNITIEGKRHELNTSGFARFRLFEITLFF